MDAERIKMLAEDVEKTIELYEEYLNNYASITRSLINRKGVLKALEDLMTSADYQQGFRVLHEHNQLDKSFESLVLKYKEDFSYAAVECAKFRLDNPEALRNLK